MINPGSEKFAAFAIRPTAWEETHRFTVIVLSSHTYRRVDTDFLLTHYDPSVDPSLEIGAYGEPDIALRIPVIQVCFVEARQPKRREGRICGSFPSLGVCYPKLRDWEPSPENIRALERGSFLRCGSDTWIFCHSIDLYVCK